MSNKSYENDNEEDYLQILNSPWNRSKSKFTFSFAKAQRFKEIKHVYELNSLCDKIYEIPSLISKKSASFAKGLRLKPMNPIPIQPSHDSYISGSTLAKDGKTFGVSREHFCKVYWKNMPCTDNKIPGPGSYRLSDFFGREGKKFSLRIKPNPIKIENNNSPGPAAYDPIRNSNCYLKSNLKTPKLSPSNSRFRYEGFLIRKQISKPCSIFG